VTGWTPLARSLLESAKNEAPSAAAKAKVWSGVSASFAAGGVTTGAVASIAPPVAAGGGIAALASAKMLAMGALLGSAVTLGIAATTFYIRVQPLPPLAPTAAMAPMALSAANGASLSSSPAEPIAAGDSPMPAVAPPRRAPVSAFSVPPGATVAARVAVKPIAAAKPAPSDAAPPDNGEDVLMREASLVAEARSALRRGDPSAGLAAIRAARALPSHQLAPEEMALEAQALRALGRANEAAGVGNALHDQFPDHALAR
jgi:hypothetical protein